MSGQSIGSPSSEVRDATWVIWCSITQSFAPGPRRRVDVEPGPLGDRGPAGEVQAAELLVRLAHPVVDIVLAGEKVHRIGQSEHEPVSADAVLERHLRVPPEVVGELEEPRPRGEPAHARRWVVEGLEYDGAVRLGGGQTPEPSMLRWGLGMTHRRRGERQTPRP